MGKGKGKRKSKRDQKEVCRRKIEELKNGGREEKKESWNKETYQKGEEKKGGKWQEKWGKGKRKENMDKSI